VLAALSATACFGSSPTQGETPVFTPLTLPTISGNTVEGEVLTETRARWSTQPVSYILQWQRCDAKGQNCQSIDKANGSTYRLTAPDVGSTIRVSENARNAAGAVTPVVSEPTAVILGHESGNRGGGGQGGGGGGSQPGSPSRPSAAELERLLARQLVTSGRAASLAALRRRGALTMRFALPETGTLTVKWYLASPGSKHGKAKRKPTLLAVGHVKLAASKTTPLSLHLTPRGRGLLRHARKLHVQAKATFSVGSAAAIVASGAFTLHV
jgi:hypothetical protein